MDRQDETLQGNEKIEVAIQAFITVLRKSV